MRTIRGYSVKLLRLVSTRASEKIIRIKFIVYVLVMILFTGWSCQGPTSFLSSPLAGEWVADDHTLLLREDRTYLRKVTINPPANDPYLNHPTSTTFSGKWNYKGQVLTLHATVLDSFFNYLPLPENPKLGNNSPVGYASQTATAFGSKDSASPLGSLWINVSDEALQVISHAPDHLYVKSYQGTIDKYTRSE